MKKLFFEIRKKMVFTERIMKIRRVRIVLLLGCLEMIPMTLWQSAVQNGYIKMESMFFVCLPERKITVM